MNHGLDCVVAEAKHSAGTPDRRSPATVPLARLPVALLVLWFAAGGPRAHGESAAPVLNLPPSKLPLEIAADLPQTMPRAEGKAWHLVDTGKAGETLPVQLVPAIAPDGTPRADHQRLIATIPPGAGDARQFRLEPVPGGNPAAKPAFRIDDVSPQSLGVWEGDRPVLVYNHGVITNPHVPKTDHRRSRGCYVHPVYGLDGEVLTDDFPRDHYHHHGLYWTWPHVKIEGVEHDLWAGSTIRQQFVRWLCRDAGPLAAVMAVENGWYVGDKKVMIERVWLRAYRARPDSRALDVELTFIPVDKPVTLWGAPGKSYGGLTMRFAPPSANDPHTRITIPSGPAPEDLYETPLAWVDFTSKFGDRADLSGAAVFVSASHPDYPPTWLTRHYGPLCVGWPGVKAKTLEPGVPVRLRYRIWIHRSAAPTEAIQQAYDAYLAAEKVALD